jgi:hypothetical protein
MYFKEAIDHILQGKKAIRKSKQGVFLVYNGDKIVSYITGVRNFFLGNSLILTNDWIIEDRNYHSSFMEMLEELMNGKKIKRESWEEGQYIKASADKREIYFYAYEPHEIDLTIQDLMANDWEIMP